MDRPPVNFAFSPCPNDTFAFHAIVHGLVPGPAVTPHLDDIEALNLRAAGPDAEVTKVSISAYGHGLRERYVLLRAGGAAGFGVGRSSFRNRPVRSVDALPFRASGPPLRCC